MGEAIPRKGAAGFRESQGPEPPFPWQWRPNGHTPRGRRDEHQEPTAPADEGEPPSRFKEAERPHLASGRFLPWTGEEARSPRVAGGAPGPLTSGLVLRVPGAQPMKTVSLSPRPGLSHSQVRRSSPGLITPLAQGLCGHHSPPAIPSSQNLQLPLRMRVTN